MAYEEYVNGFKYIEGIGAVLYATQTRPDIHHALGVLAKFGACPGNRISRHSNVFYITSRGLLGLD
jgi:hypothetical protein